MKKRGRTCPDPERLAEYLDGTLNSTQRKAVEEHLVGCEDCRDVVTETALSVEDMRSTKAGVTPSPWTRTSSNRTIDAADVRIAEAVDTPSTSETFSSKWLIGAVGALAAAAALAVAIHVAKPAPVQPSVLDNGSTSGTIANDAKSDMTAGLLTSIAKVHASPEWKAFKQSLEKERTRPVSGRLTGISHIPPPSRDRQVSLMVAARGRGGAGTSTVAAAAKLVEMAGSSPAAATALLILGDSEDAIDRFTQMIDLLHDDPARATVWNDLAVAYLASSELQDRKARFVRLAAEAAQSAIKINPTLSEAYFNYALALERLGEDSSKAWQEALDHEIDPDWANEARSHLPVKDDRDLTPAASTTR